MAVFSGTARRGDFALLDAGFHKEVVAKPSVAQPDQARRIFEGLEAFAGHAAGGIGSANHLRSVEERGPMREARFEEGSVDFAAALDEKARDGESAKFTREPVKVDPRTGAWVEPDGDVAAECCDALCRCGGLGNDDRIGGVVVRDHPRGQGRAGAAVEDEADWGAFRCALPEGEGRVIRQDRLDADEDGVVGGTKLLDAGAGSGAGDPLRFAGGRGDPAVEGERRLEGDERGVVNDPVVEPGVEFGGRSGEQSMFNADSGCPEQVESMASVGRVGIGGGNDHPSDPGGDDGLGAGRGASVGAAGFECDVEGGTPRLATVAIGVAKGLDLGVGLAGALMPAFAEDPTVADKNGADHRVGAGSTPSATGQREGPAHEPGIGDRG